MKIRIIGFVKKYFGFEEKEVHFEGKKRLDEILDFTDVPVNLMAVIVNEKAAKIDQEVENTDKVIITQIVAGGC
ncbi:MAG: hypothetical protein E3J70_03100 [Candidatus Heimdallarchaeota archaeon]|nr:MAG: hypothetical protein E3J70_03100 [Candidatus Heimdallarchaeota archaeon]